MAGNKFNEEMASKRVAMLAYMDANECSREQKLKDIFGVDINTATEREINNCDSCMSRWRKLPSFAEAWKEAMRQWDFSDYTLARSVFRKGMRQDKDAWLAMNSAVNALSHASKRIFHDEDSTITVQVEGMPEIGSPDQDDDA